MIALNNKSTSAHRKLIGYLRSLVGLRIFLLILLFSITFTQIGYSQNETSALKETLVQTPALLKGSYELPNIGFNITLPEGWSGVNHGFIAMASPDGINEVTGNLKGDQNAVLSKGNQNKTLMVIEVINLTDYQEHKYVSQIQKNCRILSEKFFVVNSIQSKEVFISCGIGSDQNIVNYIFGSGNKIIIVGLKGTGDSFDNDLNKFRNSVRTVMIKNPIEIEQIPNISSQT